jgi:hypothetical protein
MSLAATTLTTVSLTLHSLYRIDRRMRDDLEFAHELSRLARQLRTDAHEAAKATLARESPPSRETRRDIPATLTVSLRDGRTIEYAIESSSLARRVRRGDALLHRESYFLPPPWTARWQIDATRERPVVSLELVGQAKEPKGAPLGTKTLRVDATLNPSRIPHRENGG